MGQQYMDKPVKEIIEQPGIKPATADGQFLSQNRPQETLSIILDAINSSVGGLIITDLDGKIQFANQAFCRLFGYLMEEIKGLNAADLFSTKEVRTLSDAIKIIDISNESTEEFSVETKSGESLIVEVSASNVNSSSGKIVGRMASFIDITERKKIEADRDKLISKLQDALSRIKTLRGIIPICSRCKKIRDDKGYWNQIESYIRDHSDAEFSHSICPECARILYPDLFHSCD
jgi:PAS domain S-box-containing protein